MSCSIFTKNLLQDADFGSAKIDTGFLRRFMLSESETTYGVWYPLLIKNSDMKPKDITFKDLLYSAGDDLTPTFNPCECNNNIFGDGSGVLDIYNAQDFSSTPDIEIDCSYCNTCTHPSGSCSPSSTCEVRSQKDDYIPKIPYLYQGYISGFTDFKNLKEFPSCSNVGLGKDQFITMDLNSFDTKLNIDFVLKETISEIEYDPHSTRHTTEYIHAKSYAKSNMKSRTCGAFVELSGNLPASITKPYGFSKHTYDNIYLGSEKSASHWKWSPTSGVLGWYRYYDRYRSNDKRPIAGMDIYIPPGDIFFATPDGPEYSKVEDEEEEDSGGGNNEEKVDTSCPSGIKVVVNNTITQIIPTNKKFLYISENIYDRFLECEDKLRATTNYDPEKLREMSAVFATHPQYDDIVTNLHSIEVTEDRDVYGQLITLNKNMTQGTDYESAFNIYYCSTDDILIKTLAHKYGAYILADSNSTLELKPGIDSSTSYSIDLNFDMVIPNNQTRFNSSNAYSLPNDTDYKRRFEYDQKITVADRTIVSTKHNAYPAYDEECNGEDIVDDNGNVTKPAGSFTKTNWANYSTLSFYNAEVANLTNNAGAFVLKNEYSNKQPDMNRYYPATAFNPYVDLVAVHKQGGVYANSLPFQLKQSSYFIKGEAASTSGPMNISFTTKDCGIKIYDIDIKKLQTNIDSSKGCERFPYAVEDICQCYGFDLVGFEQQYYGHNSPSDAASRTLYDSKKYTPGLSTKNSPKLKRYGGYSQEHLNALFGAGVVTQDKGTITNLDYYLEPLVPYGSERQDSITLPNYTTTNWKVRLKNLAGGSHSDTIVTVNENVNLTANRFTGDPADPDYTSNDNIQWKKFTTKVQIGGKTLYNQQQDRISVSNDVDIPIKLQNPFLDKLLNDKDYVLAPPDNSINLLTSNPSIYGSRGDESSAVTLTFSRKPRKQLLNFYIPPPKAYGTLTRAIYDPNKGLKAGSNTNDPFKNDIPFHEHAFYGEPDWDENKGIMYGTINQNMLDLAKTVDGFEIGKKLKVYIQIGKNWYYLNGDKTFSYKVNNKTYIGQPRLFEYLAHLKNSQNIPAVYPLSPKKLFKWEISLHHPFPMFLKPYSNTLQTSYPELNGSNPIMPVNKKTTRTLIFPGTRYYFQVPEVIKITIPFTTEVDDNGDEVAVRVSDIKNVNGITNDFPAGSVVDFGGAKYFFTGGETNSADNYFYVGAEYKKILSLKSNIELDFDQMTIDGYIYNTNKRCNHDIKVFENNGGIIAQRQNMKVIRKEILVDSFDKNGKPSLRNVAKHQLRTKLTLNRPVEIEKFLCADIANLDKSVSMVIYIPETSDDFSESLILQNDRVTKWSDINGYDLTKTLELINNPNREVKDWFAQPVYNNYFYKEIVNNFFDSHTFKLSMKDIDSQGPIILHSNDAKFCILHKYNINKDPEIIHLRNAKDYHNFVPMMDVNLTDVKGVDKFNEAMINKIKEDSSSNIAVTGTLQSPNWLYEHDNYKSDGYITPHDSSVADKDASPNFWINIDKDDLVPTAFVPAGIYSETLRLDDPFFWLDSTYKRTTRSTDRVRTTFTPTSNTLSTSNHTLPGFSHSKTSRDYAFDIANIYADGDDKSECGAQGATDCFITTRGSVSLYATLKTAKSHSAPKIPKTANFFVTYDAGQYNPVGQRNLIRIQRSELKGDNPIESSYDNCSTGFLRPDYKRTIYDPERHSALLQGNTVSHSTAVTNLDKYANEMLFRIMYGETDIVNRNILNQDKKPLVLEDLVNFTDPKVTAADIYDEILYNYDYNTSCSCVQGSFSIKGKKEDGASYNCSVGGKDITFTITVAGSTVKAAGNIGSKSFDVELASGANIRTGVTVTEIGTTPQNTDTTTYTFQKQTNGYTSRYYGSSSGRIYTGTCAYAVRGSITSVIYSAPNIHLGLNPSNPTHAGRIPAGLSAITISNCGGSGPNSCGGNPIPIVVGEPCGYTSPDRCADRTCDDYEYGYCRRKEGCNTAQCDGEEEIENFLYSFQQCRTTFNVYGHKYKIHGPTAEETEETEEASTEGGELVNALHFLNSRGYALFGHHHPHVDTVGNEGKVPVLPTEETVPATISEQTQERFNTDEDGDKYEGLNVFPSVIVDDFIQLTDPDPNNNYSSVHCGRRVLDGNIPVQNYPYTGPYVQNWRKRSPWYRGGASSRCGAGNGVVGGDLSLSMHCGPARPIVCNPWSVYTTSLTQGGGDEGAILAYQNEKMEQPCYGTNDNPLAGEPGYDLCGLANSTVVVPGRKYYTYKTTTGSLDIGKCPEHLCTISYNSHSVTISIGGQTFCDKFSSTLSACPILEATLPAHAHIYNETVNNDCEEATRGQVILESSKQNFKTVRLRKKYYMGTISGGDANPVASVSTFRSANCGLFSSFTYCHGSAFAQCGNNSAYWIALEGWDSRGSFAPAYAAWKERMTEGFSNLNQEIGAEVGWYAYARNGRSDNSGAQRARDVCNANKHIIPASDIVQGIVPGTCGGLQFETTTVEYPKVRVGNDGGVESSTYTFYTTKAYVEYDYIRPLTVQDILKGWTEGATVPCEESRGNSSTYDEFPEWYAQDVGVSTRDTLFYPIQNYGRTGNYVRRKQTVFKETYCGDSLTSYLPDDYNKGGDSNYPYGGAPCGRNDYNCWSRNRDWITVWLE